MFNLASSLYAKTVESEEDFKNEPSYKHLYEMATGARPIMLDEVRGNYYKAEGGNIFNHTDGDNVLFTMSVAIGEDCEFKIGQSTGRTARMSERNGKVETILMKSGDAIFFDGGTVPHQIPRIIPNSGPAWWNDVKIPNGSRLVVLFREKEENFYKRMIKNAKKSDKASTTSSKFSKS